MTIAVHHLPGTGAAAAEIDGQYAGSLSYRIGRDEKGEYWTTYSTTVESRHEGQGVGSALVRRVLDDARAEGVGIKPTCWFVAGWIDRHPGHADLRR